MQRDVCCCASLCIIKHYTIEQHNTVSHSINLNAYAMHQTCAEALYVTQSVSATDRTGFCPRIGLALAH